MRFRPKGEEIDGSLLFEGRFLLLEAKWRSDALPASDVYAFKGKVDGKLVGTIGLFFSVSGFSEDAHDAIRYGKNLNVLLFNGEDLELALQRERGMKWALNQKMRAAVEQGVAFYPLRSETASTNVAPSEGDANLSANRRPIKISLIVEGPSDVRILQSIIAKAFGGAVDLSVEFTAVGGKKNLAPIANLVKQNSENRRIIIVADGDDSILRSKSEIESDLQVPADVIVIDGQIENWFEEELGLKGFTVRAFRQLPPKMRKTLEDPILHDISPRDLEARSPSFSAFMSAFRKALGAPLPKRTL